MFLSICMTLLPVSFLIVLFGGGALMKRKDINMDGVPPIQSLLFYTSKYSALVLWLVMVLQIWGVQFSLIPEIAEVGYIANFFWVLGFLLLLSGRFLLGNSFRIGSPQENTHLKTNWLYRLSRNPMYLGLYATFIASSLNTLNPIVFILMIFVMVVHHRIILGEEQYLRRVFGEEYTSYCNRVRRYL